eukprot:m.97669 g.97669  ORF g.97669 m.97669 type:complete len:54 (+) comp14839_c0_seq1:414-575(+)
MVAIEADGVDGNGVKGLVALDVELARESKSGLMVLEVMSGADDSPSWPAPLLG